MNAGSRANPALRLAALRQIHIYLGMLIAPSVLFFALTGAVQLFGLHEAHGDYHPPAIIAALASVHKDQVLDAAAHGPPPGFFDRARGGPPDLEHGPGPRPDDDHGPDHGHGPPKASAFVLKGLFLLVAAGLVTSTSLGVWMALQYNRDKRLVWLLLLIGAVAPLLALVV